MAEQPKSGSRSPPSCPRPIFPSPRPEWQRIAANRRQSPLRRLPLGRWPSLWNSDRPSQDSTRPRSRGRTTIRKVCGMLDSVISHFLPLISVPASLLSLPAAGRNTFDDQSTPPQKRARHMFRCPPLLKVRRNLEFRPDLLPHAPSIAFVTLHPLRAVVPHPSISHHRKSHLHSACASSLPSSAPAVVGANNKGKTAAPTFPRLMYVHTCVSCTNVSHCRGAGAGSGELQQKRLKMNRVHHPKRPVQNERPSFVEMGEKITRVLRHGWISMQRVMHPGLQYVIERKDSGTASVSRIRHKLGGLLNSTLLRLPENMPGQV